MTVPLSPHPGNLDPLVSQRFLRGPIPLAWLTAAAKLPGKSLHAGIAVWVMADVQNSRVIPLTNVMAVLFGLDRNAKYRALYWLEEAGLVRVARRLGRSPQVTLLHPGHDDDPP
jgi:hypothetical protein